MPESLEYLVNRGGKPDEAARILGRIDPAFKTVATTRLVAGERNSKKLTIWQLLPQLFQARRSFGTLVIWFALGMNLTVNTSLQLWLTKILVDSGFQQHTAIIATEASFLAGIVGAFIIGPLMDRFGAYRVITGLFITGGVFSVALGISLSWTAAALITASSFGSGFCTSGVQKGGNALCIYFYPTALRSTGLGWGLGIGRIGAIVGPLAVGYLLTAGWSSAAVFTATAIPMLFGAGAVAAMGRSYGEHPVAIETTQISAGPAPVKS
jgi:AAHS family 4-hydroxybenzoate transporter-like MFS transporter